MSRGLFFLVLALFLSLPRILSAQNEGPPISITSPDAATTFAYGTVKNHALLWNKRAKMLVAQVTFTDANLSITTPSDDTHEFRLPGVTFDEAKGIFFATTAKGEVIPVAHFKKIFFLKSIETLPNAVVRVLHPNGNVTVILEAISPNDPAMHPAPANADSDGTHKVDINTILH
jgi:hypothetical protein